MIRQEMYNFSLKDNPILISSGEKLKLTNLSFDCLKGFNFTNLKRETFSVDKYYPWISLTSQQYVFMDDCLRFKGKNTIFDYYSSLQNFRDLIKEALLKAARDKHLSKQFSYWAWLLKEADRNYKNINWTEYQEYKTNGFIPWTSSHVKD